MSAVCCSGAVDSFIAGEAPVGTGVEVQEGGAGAKIVCAICGFEVKVAPEIGPVELAAFGLKSGSVAPNDTWFCAAV
jgi:hypothetical protein